MSVRELPTQEQIEKLAKERYPDENIGTMRKQWLFVKDVKWAIERARETGEESNYSNFSSSSITKPPQD